MGEASVDLIIWIQETLPWLVPAAQAFTFLGDEDFYVLVFPLLYWSLSPRVGVRMGAMLLLSAGLNAALKLAFVTPRPFWVDQAVDAHAIETSFGVPSGHAQNAVVVWGVLAHAMARSATWIGAMLLVVLVGLSRWAVGVHAVEDTLVGWAVGGALLLLYVKLAAPVAAWVGTRPVRDQVALSLAVPAVLVAFGVIVRIVRAGWELPAAWAENAAAAQPGLDLDPMSLEGVFTASGALCGLGLGLVVLHQVSGGFSPGPAAWKRAACYPLGLVGVIVLWMGLGAVFPPGDAPAALALRFVRYTLVGIWIAGFAPLLFLRLGLAAPGGVESADVRG